MTSPQISAINNPPDNHLVRQSAITGDIYRDVHTTERDIPPIQAVPFTASPTAAPGVTPLRNDYTITAATHPEILIPRSTSPLLTNSGVYPQSIPAPPSPAVPVYGRLTTQLLEKLDLLISRQDLVVKFARESLIGRYGESTHQGSRPEQHSTSDVPQISTPDGIKVAAQAVSVLADRIQGLTEDLAIIRDVLGISGEASARALSEDPQNTAKSRLSGSTLPTAAHLGTSAGTSATTAIVVDDDDGVASPIEEASNERLEDAMARRRSIIERLGTMEVDVAEFMERVRDPEAKANSLREPSVKSAAESNQGEFLML